MDPKLIQAIIERIKAGHEHEAIKAEVTAVGHSPESFEAAYKMALSGLSNIPLPVTPAEVVKNESFEVNTLFKNSIELTKNNLPLLGKTILTFISALLLTAVVTGTLYFLILKSTDSSFFAFFISLTIALLLLIVSTVTSSSSLLRALLHRQSELSFKTHLKWALGAFVAVILVSLYVTIITRVGYMFLIIPGLMLNVYLALSTLVLIDGEDKGVGSLIASFKIVYGRFWEVVLRLVLSILVLTGVFLVLSALAPFALILNPFFVPVTVIAGLAVLIISWYWQLCYTVVLYESLKGSPAASPLPLSESSLLTLFRIIIAIAVTLMAIAAFFLGFAAVSSGFLNTDNQERFWDSSEVPFDVELKLSLLDSANEAGVYYQKNNTYTGLCDSLFINENAQCGDSESAYALEVPLSKGFYCVDSQDNNEVTRRSVIKGAECKRR